MAGVRAGADIACAGAAPAHAGRSEDLSITHPSAGSEWNSRRLSMQALSWSRSPQSIAISPEPSSSPSISCHICHIAGSKDVSEVSPPAVPPCLFAGVRDSRSCVESWIKVLSGDPGDRTLIREAARENSSSSIGSCLCHCFKLIELHFIAVES